jgi:hypothetical protein
MLELKVDPLVDEIQPFVFIMKVTIQFNSIKFNMYLGIYDMLYVNIITNHCPSNSGRDHQVIWRKSRSHSYR